MSIFNTFVFWVLLIGLVSCGESDAIKEVGKVTGFVTDASDGSAISGATVYVTGFKTLTSVTSESDGSFSIAESPTGNVNIYAEKTNYTTNNTEAIVVRDVTTSNVAIPLLEETFAANKIAIILSWYSTSDLDSHLLIPIDESTCTTENDRLTNGDIKFGHIDFANKGSSVDSDPFALLDTDDEDGTGDGSKELAGVETTTIKYVSGAAKCPGTYKFWVHFYTSNNSESFSDSKAVVNILVNGQTTHTIRLSQATVENSSGLNWNVLTINGGTISIDNTLTTSCYAPAAGDGHADRHCKNSGTTVNP